MMRGSEAQWRVTFSRQEGVGVQELVRMQRKDKTNPEV